MMPIRIAPPSTIRLASCAWRAARITRGQVRATKPSDCMNICVTGFAALATVNLRWVNRSISTPKGKSSAAEQD